VTAATTESHVILSLGAGVQSSTLALMAAHGDLPSEFTRPSAAIFADTGWEPARVYTHLAWLIQTLGTNLPVHVVRAMRPDGTPVHIREDSEAIVRGDVNRFANPPVFEGVGRVHAIPRSSPAGEVRGPPDSPRRDPAIRDHASLCTSIHRR
jgi:hypothetical protein